MFDAAVLLAQTESASTGLGEILFAGGWIGISILLVLLALSLTAAYLVFDHLLIIRRAVIVPRGLAEAVRSELARGSALVAQQKCEETPSLLATLLLAGLHERQFGWAAIEKSVEDSAAQQSSRLFRRIEYLSVIGNIAPMVGLLGTVTGMIIAFRAVAATQGAAGAADLAEGIYQALVTTVVGLIVAIPALGAFAVFRNRVESLLAAATEDAGHALAPLRMMAASRQATAGKKPPPGA